MAGLDLPHLHRIDTVADCLDVRPGTVRAMIARGEIACVRLSARAIRVPDSELRRLTQGIVRRPVLAE
jgi:excisionase family DNA binding protein